MKIMKLATLGASLAASAALAIDVSPQQLKSLCETSPMNTVAVNSPIKVSNFSTRVNVTTGCRIVFGFDARLEGDSINMGFAGPVVFQGGLKSGVILTKALIEAPSVTFDLAGGENIVSLGESTVRATTGNVVIAAGPISQVAIISRFATRTQAILAAGSVQISGAGKLDAQIAETTVQGNAGISINASGEELTLAIGGSNLIATNGPIAITGPGRQATFDYARGIMRAGNGVTVNLSGSEGQIAMQNVTVNAGLGSASFITALGGARPAKSVIVSSNITSGGSVTVQASNAGQSGEAALESSRVTATGDVVVRSGPLGTTNMKLNTVRSSTLVGAYTGPSGSCTAEGNTIVSPARQLCLP
jgi:hypothetical protein